MEAFFKCTLEVGRIRLDFQRLVNQISYDRSRSPNEYYAIQLIALDRYTLGLVFQNLVRTALSKSARVFG